MNGKGERALIFTGGGTGGHFFPALALAEAARERWPDLPIAFVGATRGIEARKLPEGPWPYLLLDVEGFVGRSPLQVIRSVWKLLRACWTLGRHWWRERPQAVVATGGYGAAPALLVARALGIPYFLHEANAEPGRLIALLARGARRVWCGMEAVQARLPRASCRVVGTPIRAAFRRPFRPLERLTPPFRLLVLGGSGGARALNEAWMDIAPRLLERFSEWEVLHQTGLRDFEDCRARVRHPRHTVVPFIETMDEALEQASLVLARSGASTCAELKACGRPALLVPFPTSAGDHQRRNALAMVQEGRAVLVEQGPDWIVRLEREVERLMAQPAERQALARPEINRALEHCLDDLCPVIS